MTGDDYDETTSVKDKKKELRDLSRTNTVTREKRREDAERVWRLNPIERFEEHKESLVERDLAKRMNIIHRFEDFLLNKRNAELRENTESGHELLGVRDAVEADVSAFIENDLKPDDNMSNRTIDSRLARLRGFYEVLNRKNAFAGNPVTVPLEEFRANHDLESDRPYIPFDRMQYFMNWLDQPFSRASWLLGYKHGTRAGEVLNIDLRCLHIDHPVFWQTIDNHGVQLDPRIRDRPDTVLIYEGFNEGSEIPNENTPGPETSGEVRECGNKRKEKEGSVLPVDSELKTALIEWLLVRSPTYNLQINPLFVVGATEPRRIGPHAFRHRLWGGSKYSDSIQHFGDEEQLSECPDCGGQVAEDNPSTGDKTGRRYRCRDCEQTHWRSIFWDTDLDTEQKVTFHQARHYFSSAHTPSNSQIHDGAIPDRIRKKRIRGDSENDGDTEDRVYIESQYEDYETDIREPYLNGVYKFGIYENPIPAVGEGWHE